MFSLLFSHRSRVSRKHLAFSGEAVSCGGALNIGGKGGSRLGVASAPSLRTASFACKNRGTTKVKDDSTGSVP